MERSIAGSIEPWANRKVHFVNRLDKTMLNMTNLRHYIAPAIAALATAASIASVTIGQAPAKGAEPANTLSAAEKKAGWTLLFDGKTLNGWRGYKKTDATGTRWKVEDGLLTVDPGAGNDTHGQMDIVTTSTFDRFELTWEWRIAEGGNSGLKYFVLEDQHSAIGHEYQLIDDERHRRRQDRTASSDRRALRRAARSEPAAQARRPVQPEPDRLERHDGRALPERHEGAAVRARQPCPARGNRQEQVQGHRAFRQAAERLHPAPGSRRPRLVPQHQDQAACPRPPRARRRRAKGISIVANDAGKRVDVTIDGKPFTSYIYPDTLKKPVLFPIRTSAARS